MVVPYAAGRTLMKQILMLVAFVGLASGVTQAHHSYGGFHLDRTVTVEGTLERVHYANPHTLLVIRATDSETYTAEWRPAFQLQSMGVAPTTLRSGDHITVRASPPRDASIRRIVVVKEVHRLSDGWTWRLNGGIVTVEPGI
jgi:hypothetical protein